MMVARRPREYKVIVTHSEVYNPEAVERGIRLWTTYLARHIGRRLSEEVCTRLSARRR